MQQEQWDNIQKTKAKIYFTKQREYGEADLWEVGKTVEKLARGGHTSALPNEIGSFFYLIGKVHRAIEAYEKGLQPSEDTLLDMAIYADMLLGARGVGLPEPEKGDHDVSN